MSQNTRIGYEHPNGMRFRNHKEALDWFFENEFDDLFEEFEYEGDYCDNCGFPKEAHGEIEWEFMPVCDKFKEKIKDLEKTK